MPTSLQTDLINFVCAEVSVKPSRLSPSTRLLHDLGIDGDDAIEFMANFEARFNVDLSAFEPSNHFGPEAGWNPLLFILQRIATSPARLIPITLDDLQTSIQTGYWSSKRTPSQIASIE